MKTQYRELDALILRAVRIGFRRPLYEGECAREAIRIAFATRRDAARVIDGRLQALRRRGLLAYTQKKGWVVV